MNGTIAGERDVQEIISKSRAEFERRRWILITNVPDNVDLEVRKLILMIVNNCSHPSARNLKARSIEPKFPEISVQNSMDRYGPTGKVS